VARRWVRIQLAALGLRRALLDDVEVVVSELLGNAVRHARPIAGALVFLAWRVDDGASGRAVTLQVTDGGSPGRVALCASDAAAGTGPGTGFGSGPGTGPGTGPGSGSGLGAGSGTGTSLLAETGRGLRIIDGLASAWGVVDHPGGLCTVWVTLAAGPGSRDGGVQLLVRSPLARRHLEPG
jgi:hypothetical protein